MGARGYSVTPHKSIGLEKARRKAPPYLDEKERLSFGTFTNRGIEDARATQSGSLCVLLE